MFCSECGASAKGRFCWKCGAALPPEPVEEPNRRTRSAADETILDDLPDANETWDEDELPNIGDTILDEDGLESFRRYSEARQSEFETRTVEMPAEFPVADTSVDVGEETLVVPWAHDVDFQKLTGRGGVRRQLEAAARQARGGVSADRWIDLLDNTVPRPAKAAIATMSLLEQLRVQSGESRLVALPQPTGLVSVALLKFLARHGQPLIEVRQAADGCLFVATIPADVWQCKGTLYVQLQRTEGETLAEFRAVVPGHTTDTAGRSRLLDELVGDLRRSA